MIKAMCVNFFFLTNINSSKGKCLAIPQNPVLLNSLAFATSFIAKKDPVS